MFFFSSWYIENVITKHKFILTSTELCLSFTKVKTYDNNNNWQTFKRVDLKENRNNEFNWIHFYRSNVMLMFIYLLCYDCHNANHVVWHLCSVFIYTTTISWHFSTNLKITLIFLLFFSYLCTKFPVLSDHLHCSSKFSYKYLSVNDRQMTWKLNKLMPQWFALHGLQWSTLTVSRLLSTKRWWLRFITRYFWNSSKKTNGEEKNGKERKRPKFNIVQSIISFQKQKARSIEWQWIFLVIANAALCIQTLLAIWPERKKKVMKF